MRSRKVTSVENFVAAMFSWNEWVILAIGVGMVVAYAFGKGFIRP